VTPPWQRLQAAMARDNLDGLLLASAAGTAFAMGDARRIGVHNAGLPAPAVVLTRYGPPHVITPDADGTWEVLPPGRVHPMSFDASALGRWLPSWLRFARRVGIEACSPAALASVAAALPDVELVGASNLVARAIAPKEADEVAALKRACAVAHELADANTTSSRWFPLERFGPGRAGVEVDGWAGYARVGEGDRTMIDTAIAALADGRPVDRVVRVSGVGRRKEPAVATTGAVLLVEHWRLGVTVHLADGGPEVLSP
jgi:hypothetical protein